MELHQAVAGNIHRIRKSQRLSMDRAAELAGIAVSMWGQVAVSYTHLDVYKRQPMPVRWG